MKHRYRLMCLVLSLLICTLFMPFQAFADNDDGIPSEFDPTQKGKVTPVRQTPQAYDLCWCYSTVGAVEQSLIFTGLDNASVDISESALAWFSSQSEKGNPPDSERYGSNFIIAPVYAMSRLCGLVNEIDEPTYLSAPHKNPVSYSLQGLSEFELESVEKVTADTELVKKKLMQLGGAAACYHNDQDAAVIIKVIIRVSVLMLITALLSSVGTTITAETILVLKSLKRTVRGLSKVYGGHATTMGITGYHTAKKSLLTFIFIN